MLFKFVIFHRPWVNKDCKGDRIYSIYLRLIKQNGKLIKC